MLEQGHGPVDEPLQVTARLDGGEVEAVDDTGPVPGRDQFGQVDGPSPVQRAVGAPPGPCAAVTRLRRVLTAAEIDT
ncbi:hypothetical protein ACFZC6_33220 [Streptomyces ossamyceticus]|uniref:hypothetical protein n=1 Tax=Streptomyces ossamyceticus TaxID=249581 RepID=UPI00346DC822